MPETTTILIAMAAALAGLGWLALPFFQKDVPLESDFSQVQLERLLMYYEQAMATLRDLDEDHATGKMADADYEHERAAWTARGVKVLDAINQISHMDPEDLPRQATAHHPNAEDLGNDDIDAAIEAAVRKALGAK